MTLFQEKEMREKAERKLEIFDQRQKKFNEIVNENKRKQKIIQEKISELTKLKDEV